MTGSSNEPGMRMTSMSSSDTLQVLREAMQSSTMAFVRSELKRAAAMAMRRPVPSRASKLLDFIERMFWD